MMDISNKNRSPIDTSLGADLKAVAGAIGWLAGSMSGVLALMYAVGFLCAKSHLNMLGIELYSGVAAGAYVEIGAKFFYITGIMLLERLIDLGRNVLPVLALLLIPILAVIAVIVAVIARIRHTGMRDMLQRSYEKWRNSPKDANSTRIFLCFFLAAILIWAGSQYRYVFAPVYISGVLHKTCASDTLKHIDTTSSYADLLACKIRKQDHVNIHAYYANLATMVFGLFLVLAPFRRRFLSTMLTRICYIPLMIIFIMYILVLPLDYGALVMPNDFPKVNVYSKTNSEIRIPQGSFYLIYEGQKSMILWHAGKAASYVIPISEITTLEVLGRASLFSDPPHSTNENHPGGVL